MGVVVTGRRDDAAVLAQVREWAKIVSQQRCHPDSSATEVLQAAGRHVLSLVGDDSTDSDLPPGSDERA